MNGTLTPEDTPGGGLTMVLSLPFAEQVQVQVQVPRQRYAERQEAAHELRKRRTRARALGHRGERRR